MAYSAWSVVAFETPTAAKWNILGTNDASFNDGSGIANDAITAAKINDGAILPNHLFAAASTLNTWAWDSWTPTWTNLTVSGSTVTGKYIIIGKTVFFKVNVTLGGGNAPSGSVEFTLPTTSAALIGIDRIGYAQYHDPGVTVYDGVLRLSSTTKAMLLATTASGSYTTQTAISSTVPFTFGNTDEIFAMGVYQAA